MRKRMTIRLSPKALKSLKIYKLIYNFNDKKISYNAIINLLIYYKLPRLKFSQKYVRYFNDFKKKSERIHSDKYYQNYVKTLADITNAINHLSRKFKGVANNINQLTHWVNSNSYINAINSQNLLVLLNTYKSDMVATLYFCSVLQKKVAKQWQI